MHRNSIHKVDSGVLKIEIKLPIIVLVKHHFVWEYIEKGLIKIVFVRSEENEAYIWTKNVKQNTYAKHTSKFMKDMI